MAGSFVHSCSGTAWITVIIQAYHSRYPAGTWVSDCSPTRPAIRTAARSHRNRRNQVGPPEPRTTSSQSGQLSRPGCARRRRRDRTPGPGGQAGTGPGAGPTRRPGAARTKPGHLATGVGAARGPGDLGGPLTGLASACSEGFVGAAQVVAHERGDTYAVVVLAQLAQLSHRRVRVLGEPSQAVEQRH